MMNNSKLMQNQSLCDNMNRFAAKKILKCLFFASYAVLAYLAFGRFQVNSGVKTRSLEIGVRGQSSVFGTDQAADSPVRPPLIRGGRLWVGDDGVSSMYVGGRTTGREREETGQIEIQTMNKTEEIWNARRVPAKSPSNSSSKPRKEPYIPPKLPDYRPTEVSDLFIGVKTTGVYHSSRVQLILDTWFSFAPEQVYFFTDTDDPVYQKKTNGHMVNSECQASHKLMDLACKTSSIFSMFEKTAENKRWLCHVDDDNYLNVPELIRFLNQFDHHQELYFGRESVNYRTSALNRITNETSRFWFATGGGGVCYSKSLLSRMMKFTSKGNLAKTAEKIRRPDDITVGYIIEILLGKSLTRVRSFNSHIQKMADIPTQDLIKQITLSYCINDLREKGPNLINIEPIMDGDPTRFRSFHCTYYPGYGNCPNN